MDYNELKSLMETGHGAVVMRHLEQCLGNLRDEQIDQTLPAEEYKTVSVGKHEALKTLSHMLRPFREYQSSEVKDRLKKDSLYYSHAPKK